MANAGIDRSNLGPGEGDRALLLPVDADASAARLREALAAIWPDPPAVLITDSFGRTWHYGATCVAIGADGMPSLVDRRGAFRCQRGKCEANQTYRGALTTS